MKKIILSIDGMTCSACSNGLEKYLNKQNGIYNASVNLVMANATIEYDEKILNLLKIEEFVKQAGFKSLGEFKEIKIEQKSKKEKVKFIVFTILAILLMYIAMGHMINLPTIPFLDPHHNSTNYMISLLILTSSDIGVSVNSGTDIAMDSSDVILTKNDLTSIVNLINISKKTIRNIKQNLFWAFFYNLLMIPIAIGLLKPAGISINPMIASLAMVLSSITVILNALRLKKLIIKFNTSNYNTTTNS